MPCTVMKLPGGGTAIVKHAAPRKRRCAFCDAWSGFLCDAPVGPGKTCDAPMCGEHAYIMGPDIHHCPHHHHLAPEAA